MFKSTITKPGVVSLWT